MKLFPLLLEERHFVSLKSTRAIFFMLRDLFESMRENFSNRDIIFSCMFVMKLTLKSKINLFFLKKILLPKLNIFNKNICSEKKLTL